MPHEKTRGCNQETAPYTERERNANKHGYAGCETEYVSEKLCEQTFFFTLFHDLYAHGHTRTHTFAMSSISIDVCTRNMEDGKKLLGILRRNAGFMCARNVEYTLRKSIDILLNFRPVKKNQPESYCKKLFSTLRNCVSSQILFYPLL